MRPLGVPYQNFNAENDADDRHDDQQSEDAAHEVAERDYDAGGQRKVHTKPVNNVAKIGTTFHSSRMMTPPAIR
jgi:hypothetical protein